MAMASWWRATWFFRSRGPIEAKRICWVAVAWGRPSQAIDAQVISSLSPGWLLVALLVSGVWQVSAGAPGGAGSLPPRLIQGADAFQSYALREYYLAFAGRSQLLPGGVLGDGRAGPPLMPRQSSSTGPGPPACVGVRSSSNVSQGRMALALADLCGADAFAVGQAVLGNWAPWHLLAGRSRRRAGANGVGLTLRAAGALEAAELVPGRQSGISKRGLLKPRSVAIQVAVVRLRIVAKLRAW